VQASNRKENPHVTEEQVTSVVSSLREMADFFAKHGEDLPAPTYGSVGVATVNLWYYGDEAKIAMRDVARVLKKGTSFDNPVNKHQSDYSYELSRNFGKHARLEFTTPRDAVCERKVVGKETRPVRTYVETGEFEEVEVVEWECTPLLAAEVYVLDDK
jgi:hypothetical protein